MKKLIIQTLVILNLLLWLSNQSYAKNYTWKIQEEVKLCDIEKSSHNPHIAGHCNKVDQLRELQRVENEKDDSTIDAYHDKQNTVSEPNSLSDVDLNHLSADAENAETLANSCFLHVKIYKQPNANCNEAVAILNQPLRARGSETKLR